MSAMNEGALKTAVSELSVPAGRKQLQGFGDERLLFTTIPSLPVTMPRQFTCRTVRPLTNRAPQLFLTAVSTPWLLSTHAHSTP